MRYLLFAVFVILSLSCRAQYAAIVGKVVEAGTKKPVEFAAVRIDETGAGCITEADGSFRIDKLSVTQVTLSVSCLGYDTRRLHVSVKPDSTIRVSVFLEESSLALDEVTVTAKRKVDEATTAYTIDRTLLDHLQSVSIGDAMSMLPGERTSSAYRLTDAQSIALRGGNSTELGNSAFGTIVEVDGVRMSSNAVQGMSGAPIRGIGSSNVEQIEVITGVPSVQYGDMTNGVVRVRTFSGKTPFLFEAGVRPNTQLYALSKGFDLGGRRGVLNASLERARSVADLASPYTSYVRNTLTLNYTNTWPVAGGRQLKLDAGVSGNIGGMNSESDPDAFANTYQRTKDNALRAHASATYLINNAWLSNLQAGVSFSYSDRTQQERTYQSLSVSQPSVHATQEGYWVGERYETNPHASVTLLPAGYWYQTKFDDSRPVLYNAYVKARGFHRLGRVDNHVLLGAELNAEWNAGQGVYYADRLTTADWREYRYCDLPATHNLAVYAEDEMKFVFSRTSRLSVKFGVRSDMTFVKESAYGTVSSLSPRFNLGYSFAEHTSGWLRGVTLRAGWGKAVKLPSFDVLYPRTYYRDRLAFAPATTGDGVAYYAYYTHPSALQYNSSLKWQYHIMREFGVDVRLAHMKASVSLFYNTMYHPYSTSGSTVYSPMEYKFTGQANLDACVIPVANRRYQMDQATGIVTVSDKTGVYPSQQLGYTLIRDWETATISTNTSPSTRFGVEWVFDFDRITALNTSIRVDGKYYRYRGVDRTLYQSTSSIPQTNGQPYPYVGYYVGGNGSYNGMLTRNLHTNITITTHLPKLRMLFSLRVEGTFINARQNLSENPGGMRSFVTDSRDGILPSEQGGDIYDGDHYVVTYPLYYVTRENPSELKPFFQDLIWASAHDKSLYNDLSKLVIKSNSGYLFKQWSYSPYFSANLNISKEIGNHISLAFYANNFFDTMRKIRARHTGTDISLFDSGYVTPFNYGITLKIKL